MKNGQLSTIEPRPSEAAIRKSTNEGRGTNLAWEGGSATRIFTACDDVIHVDDWTAQVDRVMQFVVALEHYCKG